MSLYKLEHVESVRFKKLENDAETLELTRIVGSAGLLDLDVIAGWV
jgi:hypothetical protein